MSSPIDGNRNVVHSATRATKVLCGYFSIVNPLTASFALNNVLLAGGIAPESPSQTPITVFVHVDRESVRKDLSEP